MMRIVRSAFPNATMTNDRFHVQKLFYEAIDELRISYRWMARDLENDEIQRCREQNIEYVPFRHTNGDTRKQLLARGKHVLVKHFTKWTETQRIRAEIIFEYYPELKTVYDLAMELTNIYNKHYDKDVARGKLALWYNKIEKLGYGCFRTVTNTMQNYYETILNYFINRETNAFAESLDQSEKQVAFLSDYAHNLDSLNYCSYSCRFITKRTFSRAVPFYIGLNFSLQMICVQ